MRYIINNGVVFISNPEEYRLNESLYIDIRSKEDRILQDNQVIKLPSTPTDYKYHREWNLRKKSYRRLFKVLKAKQPTTCLDIGCGNGWLTGKLSLGMPDCQFVGVDLNQEELLQAGRLFKRENTQFYYADLTKTPFFQNERYDIIIFNASIQYFKDLSSIVKVGVQMLNTNGQIIINDSPFYKDELAARKAAKRTKDYYDQLDVPEMSTRYFHHTIKLLYDLGFVKQSSWTDLMVGYPFPLFIFSKNS